ncbi:MAG: TIM-barrel domain-containing protein [Candidatus Rifleibacteriota bacterium]
MSSSSPIPEIFAGDLRIQILSDCLIRFERADAAGFEDQPTFHVQSRFFSMAGFAARLMHGCVRISTRLIELKIPAYIKHLNEIKYRIDGGWQNLKKPESLAPTDLPEPSQLPDYWILADYPRIIPPEHGATAPGPEFSSDMLSGWQISDNHEDFYIFFPAVAGYSRFRRELLDLTGSIPMIPRHVLGFVYSRYHPFRDSEIIELIRQYQIRRMPIDMFVVDTDWRFGGSSGYEVNTELFPNLEVFFKILHDKKIRVMFNDHPEPFDHLALSPFELQAREEALGNLLNQGLDSWWYDRNWKTALDEPAPGLGKDVWGMRLYFDITQKRKPLNRVLLMANVPGIKNGEKVGASNVATHRYPVWWTGDTQPDWLSLKNAVENAVNEGIRALLPYVSDDIGGHFGCPDSELFSRYIQFGCLSPVFRPHCTSGECRDPWEFGEEVERVMGNYLGLRLKLIPYLYSAVREASEGGTPLLRRCDLEWPEFKEARAADQYLFGSDLLVAPVFTPARRQKNGTADFAVREIWIPPGIWHDTWTGKIYQGPAKRFFRCQSWVTPIIARDGAILVGQPEILNTAQQTWQSLTIDLFVPEQKCRKSIQFYEDDGISNNFLEGEFSTTTIRLSRASDEMDLLIEPPEGDFKHGFAHRSWLLRFHFSRFSKLAAISFNGIMLMPDRYRFVSSIERPASLPFICRPGFTGKESGQTLEVPIENYDITQPLRFRLQIA